MAESPQASPTPSTSTIIYSQEPYETYSSKVTQLLKVLYPDSDNIVVERMLGGGFNRILGATLSSGERIVIRVPRFKDDDISDDIAVLRYLEHLNTIPVPHLIHYDITDQNPLESPYAIQQYIGGKTLEQLMPELTQDKHLEIATKVAQVTARICATTFTHVGILCTSSKDSVRDVGFVKPYESAVLEPFSNTLDYLIECFKSHTRRSQSLDAKATWLPSYMAKLEQVAHAVNKRRPFSNRFCLMHNDFMARNIQIVESADGELEIAVIFDWDGTRAAPIEAGYNVPHWLWTWSPQHEEGRAEIADAIPDSAQLRAVKETFEREIDSRIPGFMSMWREGLPARELFYFATNGLDYSHNAIRIDQLVQSELGIE